MAELELRPSVDYRRRWARVTDTHGRFILFDFTIGDPDLTVELIMPYPAFAEFCENNSIEPTVCPEAMGSLMALRNSIERPKAQEEK